MNVGELIAKLQEFDPKLKVAVGFYGEEQDVEQVQLVDEERRALLTATEYLVRCKWVRVGQ